MILLMPQQRQQRRREQDAMWSIGRRTFRILEHFQKWEFITAVEFRQVICQFFDKQYNLYIYVNMNARAFKLYSHICSRSLFSSLFLFFIFCTIYLKRDFVQLQLFSPLIIRVWHMLLNLKLIVDYGAHAAVWPSK